MTDAGHMQGGAPITPSPPDPEHLYTLQEAANELRRQECRRSGHDYECVEDGNGELVQVYCGRCGRTWLRTED